MHMPKLYKSNGLNASELRDMFVNHINPLTLRNRVNFNMNSKRGHLLAIANFCLKFDN